MHTCMLTFPVRADANSKISPFPSPAQPCAKRFAAEALCPWYLVRSLRAEVSLLLEDLLLFFPQLLVDLGALGRLVAVVDGL